MSIETAIFAVQRGDQQFGCVGSDLIEKLADGDILLVSRDGVDCQMELKKPVLPWDDADAKYHIKIDAEFGVKVTGYDKIYLIDGTEHGAVPALGLDRGEYFITGVNTKFTGSTCDFELGNTTDTSKVTDMEDLFRSCNWFTGVGIEYFDVSNVTNMTRTFYYCTEFQGDVSNWDVSNVENMSEMFNGAFSFASNLAHWDVGKVTSMSEMFMDTDDFNSDLSWWNVSNVKNMDAMFKNAKAFNTSCSYWCAQHFIRQPSGFAIGATNFTSAKPGWGLCPSPKPGSPPPLTTSTSPTEVSS